MIRFAKRHRTFFVEEPQILPKGETAFMDIAAHRDGLFVCVPWLPPSLSSTQVERIQRALLLEMIRDHEIDPRVLWFYTPMALGFADDIHARLIVYDCMDELSAFKDAPQGLIDRERQLFACADLVFTGGHSLYQAKRAKHHAVHAFPSSVDAKHFARARAPQASPPDQRDLQHPRLGFFGVIDERIDLDLVANVADARPDWHIVMLGPVVKIDPDTLPQRPNLHWLGNKAYDELPAYLAGWDVAIMPFARNASTEFISPTKTLEYLAAGRPVVSTPINDVVHPYGDEGLVRIAEPDRFVAEVAGALAEDPLPRRAAADAFVARTSWDDTFERMSERMNEALTSERRTLGITLREVGTCSTT